MKYSLFLYMRGLSINTRSVYLNIFLYIVVHYGPVIHLLDYFIYFYTARMSYYRCHSTDLAHCYDSVLLWHEHRPDPWATCIYTTSPPVHSSSHDIVCQWYTVPCTSSARTVTIGELYITLRILNCTGLEFKTTISC